MNSRHLKTKFCEAIQGNVTMVMSISLIPLMLLVGMAADYSRISNLWVTGQQAADAAALAAAASDLHIPDKVQGGFLGEEEAREYVARSMVNANMGSKLADYVDEIKVTASETKQQVTVQLKLHLPTTFLTIVGVNTMHASVSSTVATADNGHACMIALGEDGGGIDIGGNAAAELDGCWLYSNAAGSGSIDISSSSTVSADGACAVGEASATSSVNFTPRSHCKSISDPLASHSWPVAASPCESNNYTDSGHGSSVTRTYHPGTHCNISTNGSVADVVFEPGLYVVTGKKFDVSANTIKGSGIGIYLTSSVTTFNFNAQTLFEISAMTTGDMAGIVIAQEPGSTIMSGKFNGGSSLALNGTVYLPAMALTLNGNNSTTLSPVSQFIAYSINMLGTADIRFATDFDDAGYPNLSSVGGVVRIAQ